MKIRKIKHRFKKFFGFGSEKWSKGSKYGYGSHYGHKGNYDCDMRTRVEKQNSIDRNELEHEQN